MSRGGWGARRGLFVDQGLVFGGPFGFLALGLGLEPTQGSELAFLCLSAPSAAKEAPVLAHTKRAGRVGVGDSADPGSRR